MITLVNEFVSFGVSAVALSGSSSDSNNPQAPAGQYLDSMLRIANQIDGNLSTIADMAEIVADRVIAGGALSAKDQENAFALEAITRAGGLVLLGKGAEEGVVGKDTVLLGSSGGYRDYDISQVEEAHANDSLVVSFVSHQQEPVEGYEPFKGLPLLYEVADYSIDNFLPDNDSLVSIEGLDEKICPAALVVNALNLWVFTAEFIAACLRRGKMPAMYLSIFVPGSRMRNEKLSQYRFHSDLELEPIPPGKLGKEYLDYISNSIAQIKATELPAIKEASAVAAEAIAQGKNAYLVIMGHMPPRIVGGYSDPSVFSPISLSPQNAEEMLEKGDFVAFIEYCGIPRDVLSAVKKSGASNAWVGVPMEDDLRYPDLDIFIYPHWKFGDFSVEVPGYDVKVLPPSGVLQSIVYWLLSGEITALLAKKNMEIKVNRRPWE